MSTVDTPAAGRIARLPRWLTRLFGLAAILGPGLIAANAGNDAGGILTYASAGSQFGYRTLFLMVLITVALVVVQEMRSRLGAYTGEGLGALIREQFPLRSGATAMMLLFVANAGLTVSEFAGVGASMELFGVSRYIAVPVVLVGIWVVTVLGNYSRAERVFLVMGLVFIAYPIAAFLGHPHAGAVLSNLVWPHFLHSSAFLLLAVALIGTTITPCMQFYIAFAVVDKGITPKTYKGERVDTVNGTILSDVVSIFIYVEMGLSLSGPRSARYRRLIIDINKAVANYMLGNVVISVLATLATWIVLSILGVPYALSLGFVVGFFDLIPLVGATLGAIVVSIATLTVSFPTAALVWVAFIIVWQRFEDYVVQPLVYGKALRVNPIVTIVSVLAGASLLGILGALLAIPTAAAIQIVLRDWWANRTNDAPAAAS
jgi:NRAMP (natural resistance-associated macrophage protein)-like metal ion transporter